MTSSLDTVHSSNIAKTESSPLVFAEVDNRRGALRVTKGVEAQLTSMGTTVAIDCRMVDISENGAYISAYSTTNLSVGQRYQIELSNESDAPELASALCQGCYATIVRTELRQTNGGSAIGAGLRFDRPIYL